MIGKQLANRVRAENTAVRTGDSFWSIVLSMVASALAVGLLSVVAPRVAVVLVVIGVAILGVLFLRPSLVSAWLVAVGCLLVGYALFGRGFAYLGFPPLYIGELVLVAGILISVGLIRGLQELFMLRTSWILLAFMLFGLMRTIPFVPVFGIDALRDAVIWAYGAFAVLVGAAFRQNGRVTVACEAYSRLLPVLLLWIPLGILLPRIFPAAAISLPGSPVPLLNLKPGDAAVHLAGAFAFLSLGLHRQSKWGIRFIKKEKPWWVVWWMGLIIVGSANRGGLLAILVSIGALMWLTRSANASWLLTGIFMISILSLLGIGLSFGSRSLAVEQVVKNLGSVVGVVDDPSLTGTIRWRLAWWRTIVDYTVFGPYVWTGKGFGINLADDDGFQVSPVDATLRLRSPHNGHMTILARMGIPGFVLWVLLLASLSVGMLRLIKQLRKQKHDFEARFLTWVFLYFTASLVNAAFDVYLEGPQGGIWFWCLVGLALATMADCRSRLRSGVLDGSAVFRHRGSPSGEGASCKENCRQARSQVDY